MEKQALLILIGGRQIPNLLTAQHLRPDIIVPVASYEAQETWNTICPVLQQICNDGVQEPRFVDAFDLLQIQETCESALSEFPDTHWVFNFTCATTIMSIGTYEVAKKHGISAWYLNTATRRVVTSSGQPPETDIYKLTVKEYLHAYGRKFNITESEPLEIIKSLSTNFAQNPGKAMDFRNLLRGKADVKKDQRRTFVLNNLATDMMEICDAVCKVGLMTECQVDAHQNVTCVVPDGQLWKFMDGLWLEVYAWVAAQEAQCFDDYCYSLEIPMQIISNSNSQAKNQIDLAATYAASLIISECKTEQEPFKTQHLDQLRTIASMIGGDFVSCIFIASQRSSQPRPKEYVKFCDQAKQRKIIVVSGENLPKLPDIFKQEAQKPTYSRG